MPEQDAAQRALARTAQLAQRHAVADEFVQPELAPEPVPATTPKSGFVDFVFDEGRLLDIRDAQGRRTEFGHWLDEGKFKVLRIPHTALPSVRANSPGKMHAKADKTEVAAAWSQQPKSGTDRAKVLGAFITDWKNHGIGLIDEDVAARTGLYVYTAAPRRNELVHGGWLEATGTVGRTARNKESKRWQLTEHAIAELGLRRS